MRNTVFGLALGIWFGLFSSLMPAGTFADSQISEHTVLEGITFEPSAFVREGQMLFVIEPAPYQAQRDRAEANLASAQAGHHDPSRSSARGNQSSGEV